MPSDLAETLVARGLVPRDRVDEALRQQALAGGALDTALLEVGALTEEQLLTALGMVSGATPINLAEFEPNPEMAQLLPRQLAEKLTVVPLSMEGNSIHVAGTYPLPRAQLEEMSVLLSRKIIPWVAPTVRVRDWMASLYGSPLSARHAMALALMDPSREMPPTSAPRAPANLSLGAEPSTNFAAPGASSTPTPIKRGSTPPDFEASVLGPEPRTEVDTSPRGARSETPLNVAVPPRGALSGRPRTQPSFPAPTPAAPRSPTPAPDANGWTREQAREALQAVRGDREGLKDVMLRYARQSLEFVAAFAVIRGTVVGWDALGTDLSAGLMAQISIPLDSPSVFRAVALSRAAYVGPLPNDGLSRSFLKGFGREPRTVFLYPVDVRGKLVAVLYGDSGQKPLSQRRISELALFCQELPAAFADLIRHRKHRLKVGPLQGAEDAAVPPTKEALPSLGWSPVSKHTLSGLGRSASLATQMRSGEGLPASDFVPVIKKLLGADAAQRARAMAELTRAPEAAAKALVRDFPGPTAWSRIPVTELPEPDELGPIPAALSRLGRAGAIALSPVLDREDPDARYFALLTAGSLPFGELLPGVMRGLLDVEPELSAAARAAMSRFKKVARFEGVLKSLREELTSVDKGRGALAARALGALHDREAVEGLVALTGSQDAACAGAAADALFSITRARFGRDSRSWNAWWAENRSRPRSHWLVAALRHPEAEVRLSAIEELAAALNETLGYSTDAPLPEREAAIRRWEQVAQRDPRLRALG